jgi:hypothetical protein
VTRAERDGRRGVVRDRVEEEGAVTGGIRRARASGARRLWRVLGIGCGTPRSRHRPIAHTMLRYAEPRPLSSRDVVPNRPPAGCRGEDIDPGSAHQAATAARGPSPVAVAPRPGGCQPCPRPAVGRPATHCRAATPTGTAFHQPARAPPNGYGSIRHPLRTLAARSTIAPVERNHADRRERRRSMCTGIGRANPTPPPPPPPPPPQPQPQPQPGNGG